MEQKQFQYNGQTGFQSACDEYAQSELSLDKLFQLKSPSVYLWRASGVGQKNFNIKDGDLLIIDRKFNKPVIGRIFIAEYEGEFHLVQLRKINSELMLWPLNLSFSLADEISFQVWGAVVAIVNIQIRDGERQ